MESCGFYVAVRPTLMQVKNWCHSMDLNLPTLNYNNVIIGAFMLRG